MAEEEIINWTPDMEVYLFLSMRWNQPVGVNRHFHMLFLQERLCKAVGKWISPKQIWDHLRTLYNFESLEDIESSRLSDEDSEFMLPKEYFDADMNLKDTTAFPPSVSTTDKKCNDILGCRESARVTMDKSAEIENRFIGPRVYGETSSMSPSSGRRHRKSESRSIRKHGDRTSGSTASAPSSS